MNRLRFAALALISAVAFSSCGGKSEQTSTTTTETPATTPDSSMAGGTPAPPDTAAPKTKPATVLAESKYDSGARAGASAVNAAQADQGKALFQSKGCFACHAYGRVLTCPDLKGVSMRRTADWMEHQILHPEQMVKEDPITWELSTHYKLPMTNQGLTPEQAKAVIEHLKRLDKEAGVTAAK